MLNHLMASDNQSRRLLSPSAISASGVLHLAILAGAIYASVNAPEMVRREPELVTFLEVPKPVAPAVVEPPKPPPVTVTEVKTPPPPKGFQELVPPKEPPAAIPEIDVSAPAVSVEDFSGIGQAGGTATGVEGGIPQDVTRAPEPTPEPAAPGFAYEVAALDSPPQLRNADQVVSALARLYPPLLLKAGISGVVTIRFVVQPDGTVDASTVRVVDSSHELFDEPSVEVARRFRFRPGRYKGEPVRVLIQMPIDWQPRKQG